MAGLFAYELATPSQSLAQKRGERVRVLSGSALRTTPTGDVIGVLSRTFDGQVEAVLGTAVRLHINGFVDAKLLAVAPKSRTVIGAAGGTLRDGATEKAPALAELRKGATVFPGEKSGTFVAISRPIWVDKSRLSKFVAAKPTEATPTTVKPAAAAPAAQAAPQKSASAPPTSMIGKAALVEVPGSPLETGIQSSLRKGPDGDALLTLPTGTLVTPLASENGWTRVRVEGWVPSKDLIDAEAHAAGSITAADLRADPDGNKGKIVHWSVEALSYQLGDALRRELNGEPYLLARGPGKERAILYLAVPDSLVTAARALPALSSINITARVRSGRSQPAGIPILDLLELFRR
ncbi:MAG: hypothetical protein ABJB66_11515 [Gemmatimonadaceae bacterium]